MGMGMGMNRYSVCGWIRGICVTMRGYIVLVWFIDGFCCVVLWVDGWMEEGGREGGVLMR